MSTGLCPTCLVGMEPATSRDGGLLWRCADCGHEAIRRVVPLGRREQSRRDEVAELTGITNTNGAVAPAMRPQTEARTWDELARQRLDVVLRGITAVEQLQREAEKIHAALSVYGADGLPELNWVRRKVAREGPVIPQPGRRRPDIVDSQKETYRTPDCIYCGYTFERPTDMVITSLGSVCRWERLCGERKAKAGAA